MKTWVTRSTVVKLNPNGQAAILLEEIIFFIDDQKWVIPIGFETDFASVPRVLWPVFPPTGRYSNAAVVHDYLYFIGKISRKQSDKVFLSLMEFLGVPFWKRQMMYRAVRIGGWYAWRKHRENGGGGE